MLGRGKSRKASDERKVSIKAIDLFCGAGGLTRGLETAGIDVVAGVDIDPACEYPYTANNRAVFYLKSVEDISGPELANDLAGASLTLLAGCAPCQPFSTYSRGKSGPKDRRWNLLNQFARLVSEMQPDLVTMENVPRLAKQAVFERFVSELEEAGYSVFYRVVDCADYGVPQHRHRLVLLASKHGPIEMIAPIVKPERRQTVRRVIGSLPPLRAGEMCPDDPLHLASTLSPLNLQRICASKSGGTWRDWKEDLVADCHKKKSGKTYPSVYGRMAWDEPAPTMTTQFFGFGNGRFGHPQQNRAISLREGAILQSFPRNYKFVAKDEPIYIKTVGRLIGNAVPVKLGKAIGMSILDHVQQIEARQGFDS
ncbi:DNA cytosine methyltransferase [Azospirillum argentinense]|uniref:DNA (cytosine-5-)-methyltransferase n=1 Tax=Azospirillum argentinense TaxID=2970906 RepID=A0A5B0KP70_9PROT|nr:DNA cytosine methyltransferase [Azospirillum argentinense]KAA1054432.1 DNA-cytosine methyltransferase [Azospirillum argentinense]